MTTKEKIGPPAESEYLPYYGTYISLIDNPDIVAVLESQIAEFRDVLSDIPDGEASRLHEPYTWTIKQVVGHLIDCERVFGYRLAWFAAKNQTPLPGMDQNEFVDAMNYESVSLADLVDELEWTRRSNLGLLNRLEPSAWDSRGVADGNEITVRAIAYILGGHIAYHLRIVRARLASES